MLTRSQPLAGEAPGEAQGVGSLDPVSVKSFMGHAKLTTTERYLHARSRRTDAMRLTKTFGLQDNDTTADVGSMTATRDTGRTQQEGS